MTKEMIAAVLEAEGCKATNHAHTIADERDATCFIATHGEILNVMRVTKIDLRGPYVALHTSKDERLYFAYEDVLGLRLSGTANTRERGAGFSR